jgi:hypothetical protein
MIRNSKQLGKYIAQTKSNTTYEIKNGPKTLVLYLSFSETSGSLRYADVTLSSDKNEYNCVLDAQCGITVWDYNGTISLAVGALDKSIQCEFKKDTSGRLVLFYAKLVVYRESYIFSNIKMGQHSDLRETNDEMEQKL